MIEFKVKSTTFKVETSELTGAALNWAVARALGKRPSVFIFQQTGKLAPEHNYSTNWAQGGPIIEREKQVIAYEYGPEVWHAYLQVKGGTYYGPTPLIAAMRCYVASKLGEEVDVPEELT